MKKTILILAALVGIFIFATVACAEGETDRTTDAAGIAVPNNPEEISVLVDGVNVAFDVPPQILNDRVVVPLRAIFEMMGAEVNWNDETKTVTATKEGVAVVLTVGDLNPTVNGKVVEIDQPGVIVDGRTLAPLRFVAEAFGGTVTWDGDTRTAGISLPGEAAGDSDVTEEEADNTNPEGEMGEVTKLLYQGHGSYRITTKDGTVVYVDPYIGEGYDVPADIILVTHQHPDHNQVSLVTQKDNCTLITNAEALKDGKYSSFAVGGVKIEAVMAGNQKHDPKECVGYMITVDGVLIYAAGDTSLTEEMASYAARKIDYALLPCDGVYNMDLKEAAECAELIGAKHNIPIHMAPGALFDKSKADQWTAPNKLIVAAGETITLSPAR